MTNTPKFCSNCGTALASEAKFCHECGISLTGSTAARAGGGPSARGNAVRWGVPLVALAVVITLVAIQFTSTSDPAASQGGTPLGGMRAPDLSTMTPDEQADRLFNRVMLLAEQGKTDSIAFFAPMAIGAIEALRPLDSHRRYDIGLVSVVSGNIEMAKAQVDTILKARPNHLLGLILALRAADAAGKSAEAASWRQKLLAAEASEKAAGLPEYTFHQNDIDQAIREAKGR
jgi:hypothetical protein